MWFGLIQKHLVFVFKQKGKDVYSGRTNTFEISVGTLSSRDSGLHH